MIRFAHVVGELGFCVARACYANGLTLSALSEVACWSSSPGSVSCAPPSDSTSCGSPSNIVRNCWQQWE